MSTQINIATRLPYKVYTALLTQKDGDNQQNITGGDLTIGVTYRIGDQAGGTWDFTNVGAPDNNIDTYFVATGTTPNSWGDGMLIYNTGAPVVTVLENTIGNIWWTYNGAGTYNLNSLELFINDKTYCQNVVLSQAPTFLYHNLKDTSTIEFLSTDGDDKLRSAPLEIRVYN
jgi:hypothetical protein